MDMAKSIKIICQRLFDAEDRRLDKTIEHLDKQNREIKRLKANGFMLQGKIFYPRSSTLFGGPGQATPSLDLSLMDQAREFLADLQAINNDKKMIEQFLAKLLWHCRTAQECRDTIPECLLEYVSEWNVPRVYSPGFFAPKDERFRREAEKIIPMIEMYSVTRLLY